MKKIVLILLMLMALFSVMAQQITKMEYFVDTEPGFGNGINIPVAPSADVTAGFNIDASGLTPGVHIVCVRAREDDTGGENRVWGAIASSLFITVDLQPIPDISMLEYFVDTDPGVGLATPVTIANGKNISATFPININGLVPGLHMVVARVKNAYNEWSVVASSMFYAWEPVAGADITQMEYFFDTDPGFGAGNQVSIVPGKNISVVFNPGTYGLFPGIHLLYFRTKNSANRWSVTSVSTFLNIDVSVPDIVQLEYFLDDDPGYGAGIQVPITPGQNISGVVTIDTTGLSLGRHFLLVRAKNTRNSWGIVSYQEFSIFKSKLFLEGLFISSAGTMSPAQNEYGNQWGPDIADHITLQLRDQDPPYGIVFEAESELKTDGMVTMLIPQHLEQNYITVRQRNSIETWSAAPVSITALTTPYDFTSAASMAFGDNMKPVGSAYVIWGGDVNQDGIVDSGDMNPIENASVSLTMGYVAEDVNGDGIVDSGDMNIVENNSIALVSVITP
jgi:hypothetical protein